MDKYRIKNLISLIALFILSAITLESARSSQAQNTVDLTEPSTLKETVETWPRVKAKFNRPKFLQDYDIEFGTTHSQILSAQWDEKELNDKCWSLLFKLVKYYKGQSDYQNYTFGYQSMAKFLLTYEAYPPDYTHFFVQKTFLSKLIDHIGIRITPQCKQHKKLQKWFHIYESMLFLRYADQFATSERRNKYISNAYCEIVRAMDLKTTRTVYYLAAEILEDYHYIPPGITAEDAKILACDYLKKAQEKSNRPYAMKQRLNSPVLKPTVEVHAQPTYINQLDYPYESQGCQPEDDVDLQATGTQSHTTVTAAISSVFPVEDELREYDFETLSIPQCSNPENLPIRDKVSNKVGELKKTYRIDGQTFRLQNVLGVRMRCFFNAMGLNADGQIEQLKFFANDPIVRLMIANEIVSAAAIPDELPNELKKAINFDLYQRQRNNLNELDQKRNDLLRSQNPDSNLQDTSTLPRGYRTLRQRGDGILNDLLKRALSLEAYRCFIKYCLSKDQMMVFLLDVTANGNGNFTSVDALAYLNKIGIKVFQPNAIGALRLIHQYIPEGAQELAYLYHKDLHFQALVPVRETQGTEADKEVEMQEAVEEKQGAQPTSQDCSKPIEKSLEDIDDNFINQRPSNQQLRERYPHVVTSVYRHQYDSDLVRQILYAAQVLKNDNKTIASNENLDTRRISEILTSNGIRKAFKLSIEVQEQLLGVYLQFYKDLKSKKIGSKDLCRAFVQKYYQNKPTKAPQVSVESKFYKLTHEEPLDAHQNLCNQVTQLYLKGHTFFDIRDESALNFSTIISILSESIDPKDYHQNFELNIPKASLSEQEKEDLIIETFHIVKKELNRNPPVLEVQKRLKDQGIGYKPVERILKAKGLVEKRLKSSHLSEHKKQQIIMEFNTIAPSYGKVQETYQQLAKKYNVSLSQIKDFIKQRTYKSGRSKSIQMNYDSVVKAYHQLNEEQKKSPVKYILKMVNLKKGAINSILEKAGIYAWNGLLGKRAANALVVKQSVTEEGSSQSRKRNLSGIADNLSGLRLTQKFSPPSKKVRRR